MNNQTIQQNKPILPDTPRDAPFRSSSSGGILLLLACLLGIAAIIPYAQSYYFDFVWDDVFLIKNNPRLDAPGYLRDIWFSDYFHHLAEPARSFFWRPMVRFSMYADYKFFGRNPEGFHLTNLILFGTLAGVLFVFLRHFVNTVPAVAATLLYAWHPLRVEIAAWISARTETMALLFGLISLLLLFRSLSRHGKVAAIWLTAALISLSVALLSKESAVLFPILAVILKPRELKRHWLSFTLFTLPVAGWFAARQVAVGFRHWFPQLVEPALIPATAFRATLHYFMLHVRPVGLSAEPWFDFPEHSGEPGVILGILLVSGLAGIALWRRNTIARGIAWFFLGLLPFLQILPLPERAADRYTTMASVGCVLAIAAAVQSIRNRHLQRAATVLMFIAAGACAVLSAQLTTSWMSDSDIRHRAARYGESPQALFYRGSDALREGRFTEAFTAFDTALTRTHDPSDVLLFQLAMTEIQLEKIDRAVTHLEQLVASYPEHPMGGMILGELYMRTGKFREALRLMKSQASRFPDNPVPHLVIGQVCMDYLNQPRVAEQAFREALRRNARGPQREFAEDRLRQLVQVPADR
ncbi:MAG TPA: tetratricopeptide repeat protein [bacterium]|nr:tetratricopeptide repeat protein [bacterium]